jgi:hypothetical protein
MGAKLLNEPAIELDEAEAKKLSDALKNVARQYQTVVDPKKLALIQLATVGAGIYVPRFIVMFKRKPRSVAGEVVDIKTRQPEQRQAMSTSPPAQPANRPQSPSELWSDPPIDS